MFCKKCGAQISDNAKFCKNCGEPISPADSAESETVPSADSEQVQDAGKGVQTPKSRRTARIILIVVIIVAAAVVAAFFVTRYVQNRAELSPEEHMERGIQYLDDEKYEEAVAEFTEVIDVEPNMQAYSYLAEAYLDLSEPEDAGEVYEEAVVYALDTYEQTDDLPENTTDMYEAAQDYTADYGEVKRLDELGDVIFPSSSEDPGVKPSDDNTETEDAPSVEEVLALLNSFPNMADEMLFEYYAGVNDVLADGITDAEDVYYLAAMAIAASGEAYTGTPYTYKNGTMKERETGEAGEVYNVLPTDMYEDYLRNMFGQEYSTEDFVGKTDWVIKDNSGNFYIKTGELGYFDVTVSVEQIYTPPNEDGTYNVLAKYQSYDGETKEPLTPQYMLYRLRPDENSDYGYVIADMIPAGQDVIDGNVLSGSSPQDAEEEQEEEQNSKYNEVKTQFQNYMIDMSQGENSSVFGHFDSNYTNDSLSLRVGSSRQFYAFSRTATSEGHTNEDEFEEEGFHLAWEAYVLTEDSGYVADQDGVVLSSPRHGVPATIGKTVVGVKWLTARFDKAGTYVIKLFLIDEEDNIVSETTSGTITVTS